MAGLKPFERRSQRAGAGSQKGAVSLATFGGYSSAKAVNEG
jgi:hypothetical protein